MSARTLSTSTTLSTSVPYLHSIRNVDCGSSHRARLCVFSEGLLTYDHDILYAPQPSRARWHPTRSRTYGVLARSRTAPIHPIAAVPCVKVVLHSNAWDAPSPDADVARASYFLRIAAEGKKVRFYFLPSLYSWHFSRYPHGHVRKVEVAVLL